MLYNTYILDNKIAPYLKLNGWQSLNHEVITSSTPNPKTTCLLIIVYYILKNEVLLITNAITETTISTSIDHKRDNGNHYKYKY